MISLHNYLFFHNVESKCSIPLRKNYDMQATSCASSSTTDFYLKICAAECCIIIFYLFNKGIIIFSKLDKCTFKTGQPCSKQNKTDASNFYFCKLNFIYLFKETFLVLSFHTNKIKDNIKINKTTFKDKNVIAFKNISREET